MSKDKTIDYESGRRTLVFWNMDEYPITVGTSDELGSVTSKMVEALRLMGFRGYMDVRVYSERPKSYKKEKLWMGSISYVPKCKSYSADVYELPDITLYIIRSTTNVGPGPFNVAIISKPNRELRRVMQCLKSRNHDVLFIDPLPGCPFFSVESLLLNNARLLGAGGKPRFKDMLPDYLYPEDIDEKDLEIKEDVSKTVDFTERIPTVKGIRTVVFWDAEDCPFPLRFTPDEIYHSVAESLVERDSLDKVTIWAYGPWSDVLMGHKTWASRIYFLPGGDKASRRNRMLNDMYLWVRDTPRKNRRFEVTLVLLSDQFNDGAYYTDMLQTLSERVRYLFLVTPTQDINDPQSPEWPGLLIDEGAYCFGD